MRLTTLSVVSAVAFSLLATTAAQATNIRVAGNFAGDHTSSIAMETFKAKVEELSDGAMTVQLFPNMQLGGAQENVDQVRTGAVQMTWIGIAFLSRLVPELEAVSLPFVFGNREQAFRVIDGEVGERLDTAMRERGLTSLGYMELGARHVTNSVRPIESADDLQGLRIRLQPNETHLATFRALGANPVAMDISEVYSALQQRVLDGQENPYSINTTRNFYEVQRYLSDTSHFFDFIVTVANANWFDGLPEEQRSIVVEAMDATNVRQRELAVAADEAALGELQELGMVFTPLSDEARAELQSLAAPVVDQLRARLGDELIDLVLQGAAES
ncbi:MAG: TRAP transporter substrate-binding protein [Geminicoccaceae bacterium]|nr:MAG: TRAP transporter substrate-binding protein [Geminicoccaceae bacterium]